MIHMPTHAEITNAAHRRSRIAAEFRAQILPMLVSIFVAVAVPARALMPLRHTDSATGSTKLGKQHHLDSLALRLTHGSSRLWVLEAFFINLDGKRCQQGYARRFRTDSTVELRRCLHGFLSTSMQRWQLTRVGALGDTIEIDHVAFELRFASGLADLDSLTLRRRAEHGSEAAVDSVFRSLR
jgi:hypothetical protein